MSPGSAEVPGPLVGRKDFIGRKGVSGFVCGAMVADVGVGGDARTGSAAGVGFDAASTVCAAGMMIVAEVIVL